MRRRRRPRSRPPQPEGEVFELTDEMAVPDRRRRRSPSFQKVEPQDDLEFAERPPPGARSGSRRSSRRRLKARRAAAADPVALDGVGGRIRLQQPRQYRAQQQRAHAGRPGQGNAAADAEILARRQSAGAGGAHRQGGNRAGFARRTLSAPQVRLRSIGLQAVAVPAFIQPPHRALSTADSRLSC